MKYLHIRLLALALVAITASFLVPSHASAAAYVNIQVGTPPPVAPGYVDRPWGRPYHGAVWIAPHYEWINGRWVWVRGYYAYPPRPGMVWVSGRYSHGYWRGGYWR